MLSIEYLSKFGYAIDWDDTVFIIDYTGGRLPSAYLKDTKQTFFLVSDVTKDHYDPSIKVYKKPIVSPKDLLIEQELIVVSYGDAVHFGNFKVRSVGDKSIGMGFVISKEGLDIFHTGSLTSNFNDKDPSNTQIIQAKMKYKELVDTLKKDIDLDILITQVNPLDGMDYDHDSRYLIETLEPIKVMPSNFGNVIADISRFVKWVKEEKHIDYMGAKHENKKYRIENL